MARPSASEETVVARFWAKVDVREKNECWPWLGMRDAAGYGRLWVGRRRVYAHRLALQLNGVELLLGEQGHHQCENKSCVNSLHLAAVLPGAHRDLHKTWDQDAIVQAILGFHSEFGRPPSAPDWDPYVARRIGHARRAVLFQQHDDWPSTSTVVKVFGSWGRAIAAAGFQHHGKGRPRGQVLVIR